MSNIWNHHPGLSSPPKQKVLGHIITNDNRIDEYAAFLLENESYVVLHFCGVADNEVVGITSVEEFSSLSEATEYYWSIFPEDPCSSEDS